VLLTIGQYYEIVDEKRRIRAMRVKAGKASQIRPEIRLDEDDSDEDPPERPSKKAKAAFTEDDLDLEVPVKRKETKPAPKTRPQAKKKAPNWVPISRGDTADKPSRKRKPDYMDIDDPDNESGKPVAVL